MTGRWFSNGCTLSLFLAATLAGSELPRPPASSDCNRNGIEDHLDLGTIDFVPRQSQTAGTWPIVVAVQDLDNQAPPEIILVDADRLGRAVHVHTAQGQLFFSVPLPATPGALAFADVDADGWTDVLTTHPEADQVTILFNQGGNDLIAPCNKLVGREPVSIAAVDVDQDGAPDVLTANRASHDVTVLFGDGNGAFPPRLRQDYGTDPAAEPRSLVVGYFDADLRLDIATANGSGSSVTILLQRDDPDANAGVTFVPRRIFLGDGIHPIAIVAADFDGDGLQDLATANEESNSVTILTNGRVAPGFFFRRDVPTGGLPQDVVVADFEGDGDFDLATLNSDSRDVIVHINEGIGTFTKTLCIPASSGRPGLACGPLLGAGGPDLVTADGRAGTLTIFANLSRQPVALDVNRNGFPDACEQPFQRGDCNGDGRVELSDALFLLNYAFLGTEPPSCFAACDMDSDGSIGGNPGDALYLLNFQFLGGPPLRAPASRCDQGEPSDFALGCTRDNCH